MVLENEEGEKEEKEVECSFSLAVGGGEKEEEVEWGRGVRGLMQGRRAKTPKRIGEGSKVEEAAGLLPVGRWMGGCMFCCGLTFETLNDGEEREQHCEGEG